jgi:hypothetical protein
MGNVAASKLSQSYLLEHRLGSLVYVTCPDSRLYGQVTRPIAETLNTITVYLLCEMLLSPLRPVPTMVEETYSGCSICSDRGATGLTR